MSKQLAFYFDQTRCINCNACSVACKDWNGVNPGPVAYRKVSVKHEGKAFPNIKVFPMSEACNHCDNPPCVAACGAAAIEKRADGIVMIHRDKCAGLKDCVPACPYGAIGIATEPQEKPLADKNWQVDHPAQKCHMCYDRIDSNLKPVCVAACPQRALDVDTVDALKKKYGKDIAQRENLKGTGPNFYIKKKS